MGGDEMSPFKPCFFGVSLQQGTQLIAAVNIAFETLLLVILTIYCVLFDSVAVELGGQYKDKLSGTVLMIWIIATIILALCITANYYLLKGATEKSTRKIKIYLILFSIFCMFGFISSLARGLSWTLIVLTILTYLPAAYEFWVIFSFLRQLRSVDQIA